MIECSGEEEDDEDDDDEMMMMHSIKGFIYSFPRLFSQFLSL